MASYSTSDKFNRYHHAKTLSDSKGESHGTHGGLRSFAKVHIGCFRGWWWGRGSMMIKMNIYIYVNMLQNVIMTIHSVAVVGLILLFVASVVVNDDGQLWRLHKMGLPLNYPCSWFSILYIYIDIYIEIDIYIYKQSILGCPYFLGNPDALLQQCWGN